MKALLAVVILAFGASAWADTSKAPATQRVKSYSYEPQVIDGKNVGPRGEVVPVRTFPEHGSLLVVRADFLREITKSAEDL